MAGFRVAPLPAATAACIGGATSFAGFPGIAGIAGIVTPMDFSKKVSSQKTLFRAR
jgi:hypothetical protein